MSYYEHVFITRPEIAPQQVDTLVEEIKTIQFDHNDVVRHPLVSKIIKAYQKKDNDQS